MHKNAIEARFPHLSSLFTYDDANGQITGMNKDFTWHGLDAYTIAEMIIHMAESYERVNLQRFTNVDDLTDAIESTFMGKQ